MKSFHPHPAELVLVKRRDHPCLGLVIGDAGIPGAGLAAVLVSGRICFYHPSNMSPVSDPDNHG